MKNSDFILKIEGLLKTRNLESSEVDGIITDITKLLLPYKLSKDLRKTPRLRTNIKSYRVRYKIYDEKKGYWIQNETIKEGFKAADVRDMVKEEFPGCRVTSSWLIE